MKKIWLASLLFVSILAYASENNQKTIRPAFTIGAITAPKIIELFFSPGCPDCFLAFRNAVHQLEKEQISRGEILLIVHIMPRNVDDLKIGQILMCVPPKNLRSLTLDYMKSRGIGIRYSDEELLTTINKYGSTASSLEDCISKDNEIELRKNNVLGMNLGIDDTPAWFIDGARHQGVYFYWQLQHILNGAKQ